MPNKRDTYSRDNGFTFEDDLDYGNDNGTSGFTFDYNVDNRQYTDDFSYGVSQQDLNWEAQSFLFETSNYIPNTSKQEQGPKEVKNIKPRKPDKESSNKKGKSKKQKQGLSRNAFLGMIIAAVAVIFVIGTIIIINLNKSNSGEIPVDNTVEQAEKIAETLEINRVMSAAQKVSKAEFREILKNSGYEESEINEMLEKDTSVDWVQNAKDRAKLFIENVGTNEIELKDNLDELGFTDEEINAALESVKDTDWNEQAVRRGTLYLEKHVITKEQMIEVLKEDGFTQEQSEYAAESLPCDTED